MKRRIENDMWHKDKCVERRKEGEGEEKEGAEKRGNKEVGQSQGGAP